MASCRQNNVISCLGRPLSQLRTTRPEWEEALGTHSAAWAHRPLPCKFLKSFPLEGSQVPLLPSSMAGAGGGSLNSAGGLPIYRQKGPLGR